MATTNCPLGKNAAAPPCELAVMAAGVTLAAAWPDGLNSAQAGRVKMSPAASRPSATAPPGPPITVPPLPKEVSGVPPG